MKTARKAGLNEGQERDLRPHDLRRSFGSLLIAAGGDVKFVQTQMGHEPPMVTLEVYAEEFGRVSHADAARAALDAFYVAESASSASAAPFAQRVESVR